MSGRFAVPRDEFHRMLANGRVIFDGAVLDASLDPDPVFDLLWHPRPPWWRPVWRWRWDRDLRRRRDLMRTVGAEARFWR